MIAVHGVFSTKWRRVTKREIIGGVLRKRMAVENCGLEEGHSKHVFIGMDKTWKAPCGATSRRIVGVATPFEEKIRIFKASFRPCKKCKAWLAKNEASLRMAEAVS